MYRPCEELFSRAALPGYKHRNVRCGDLSNGVKYMLHTRACPDNLGEFALSEFFLKRAVLLFECAHIKGSLQYHFQLIDVYGFDEEIVRAEAYGLKGRRPVGVAGNYYDLGKRVRVENFLEKPETPGCVMWLRGQPQVQGYKLRAFCIEELHCPGDIRCKAYLVVLYEGPLHMGPYGLVVVYDEYLRFFHCPLLLQGLGFSLQTHWPGTKVALP